MHMAAWEKELGEERVKGRAVLGTRTWSIVVGRERQLLADSVEKVGFQIARSLSAEKCILFARIYAKSEPAIIFSK